MANINKEAVTAIREAFTAAKGRELKLSDETINGIFNSEKWEELEEDGQMELLLKSEGIALSVMVTDPGISVLVSKLEADDEFQSELTDCIDAVMKNKTTAIDVYAQFRRILTKEDMDGAPFPGTDKDTVFGNHRPDKVVRVDQTGKEIVTVWTNDFVSALGRGKQYEGIIDEVKKEQKTPGSTQYKGKSKKELASLLSDATARRNAMRSMVKRALAFHHQFEAIAAMPQVEIEFIPGEGSSATLIPDRFGVNSHKGIKVTGAPKPIWIYPKGAASNGRDFSVTQVLAFDTAKALKGENGGSMADLVATAGTGAGTGEGEAAVTLDDFVKLAPDFWNVLNDRANMATLLKMVAPKKDDTAPDDLLESVCSVYLALKPIYDKNKTRYETIINRKDEQEDAA